MDPNLFAVDGPRLLEVLLLVGRQNISDKRTPLLRDGSWFWPRPRWRPDTPFCDVAS
jgi:hypothetical protein